MLEGVWKGEARCVCAGCVGGIGTLPPYLGSRRGFWGDGEKEVVIWEGEHERGLYEPFIEGDGVLGNMFEDFHNSGAGGAIAVQILSSGHTA